MISAWRAPSALGSIQVAPAADTVTGVGSDAHGRHHDPGSPEGEDRSVERSIVREVASLVARLAALTWCWTLIWLLLWSVAPTVAGWTPVVVTSASMEPALPIGSVVQVDDSVDFAAVGAGAIITFDDPAVPGRRVTHRVTGVERSDAGGGEVVAFRTKGDANAAVDSTLVPVANVDGVARLVVPLAGLPKAWSVNGEWVALTAFVAVTIGASALSIDTIRRFVRSSSRRPGRRSRRTTAAAAVAVAAMLGAPPTGAAFSAATGAGTTQFSMTSQWFIDSIDRDAPIAHWRLGESSGGAPTVVLTDGFETLTGWNNLGSGSIVSSTAVARSGVRSALKTGNNDPNGGWKLLPAAIANDFVFEVWVYRPGNFSGGAIDRVGLEDAGFNGYTFAADHGGNTLRIDRRTGGSASGIGSSVAFDPPENSWYRLRLVRTGSGLTLSAFSAGGALMATTTAVDATTTSFDRVTVRGGWDYHLDDLQVSIVSGGTPTVAVDRIGTLDASYVGNPALGQPGLVTSDADTAVAFDGANDVVLVGDSPLINTGSRDTRTVELWFRADQVGGRQVLYEEGGTVNGLNVYLDGSQLYATAWSNTSGWSKHLVTTTPSSIVAGTRYHVAVALDAVATRTLTMFLDGAVVDVDTKSDTGTLASHTDDGGIGALNSDTRFHDGTAQGGGFYFDGTIDEVVLFNSVVAETRIANHFAAGG